MPPRGLRCRWIIWTSKGWFVSLATESVGVIIRITEGNSETQTDAVVYKQVPDSAYDSAAYDRVKTNCRSRKQKEVLGGCES